MELFTHINKDMANFTLEEIASATVHHNAKPPKVLASESGIGYNYLSRMVNPTDESCQLSIIQVIPLMKAAEDYSILEKINHTCGFLMVKMPRGIRKGTDPKMEAYAYSKKFNQVFDALVDFIKEPTERKREDVLGLMKTHLGDTVNMSRRVENADFEQMEMSL